MTKKFYTLIVSGRKELVYTGTLEECNAVKTFLIMNGTNRKRILISDNKMRLQ